MQGTFELRDVRGILGGESKNFSQLESPVESADFISPAVQEPEHLVVTPLGQCTRRQGGIRG